MSTLSIFFSALGLLISASAVASTPTSTSTQSSSSTLNDIANMQMTLEKAEYEKKLSELRRGSVGGQGGGSAAALPSSGNSANVSPDAPVNPVLKGVYGLGKRLYAIVDMDGTEVEFSTGDTYFGYRALSISPLETVLVKLDSKGRSSGGKVYRLRLTGAGDMSALRNLPPLPSVPGLPTAIGEPERSSASPARTPAAPRTSSATTRPAAAARSAGATAAPSSAPTPARPGSTGASAAAPAAPGSMQK